TEQVSHVIVTSQYRYSGRSEVAWIVPRLAKLARPPAECTGLPTPGDRRHCTLEGPLRRLGHLVRMVLRQSARQDCNFVHSAGQPTLMSALPPKADIPESAWHVRLVPKADITGIQGTTGKWVSNVLLISITFSLVKPPPAASSEIALR